NPPPKPRPCDTPTIIVELIATANARSRNMDVVLIASNNFSLSHCAHTRSSNKTLTLFLRLRFGGLAFQDDFLRVRQRLVGDCAVDGLPRHHVVVCAVNGV